MEVSRAIFDKFNSYEVWDRAVWLQSTEVSEELLHHAPVLYPEGESSKFLQNAGVTSQKILIFTDTARASRQVFKHILMWL